MKTFRTKILTISLKEGIITKKPENIMAKGEIACFEQFLLLSQCFKCRLLQRRQNGSINGKGLR